MCDEAQTKQKETKHWWQTQFCRGKKAGHQDLVMDIIWTNGKTVGALFSRSGCHGHTYTADPFAIIHKNNDEYGNLFCWHDAINSKIFTSVDLMFVVWLRRFTIQLILYWTVHSIRKLEMLVFIIRRIAWNRVQSFEGFKHKAHRYKQKHMWNTDFPFLVQVHF